MSLSDDLAKMEVLSEASVTKLYKQLTDLKPDEDPTIIGGAPAFRPYSLFARAPPPPLPPRPPPSGSRARSRPPDRRHGAQCP